MPIFYWIVIFTAVGGICSALIASVFLLFSEERRRVTLPYLLSFATGAQLGVAYLALYPEASQEVGPHHQRLLGILVVVGIMAFFMLEKWMRWHQHGAEPVHRDAGELDMAGGSLILIGDGVHNAIHGVLIAASFLASIQLGLVMTLAVLAHEIPLEVSDIAILVGSGMSRMRAFILNALVGVATMVGGLVAYFALDQTRSILPYILTIAIANMTYISLADLVPNMHKRTGLAEALWQFGLIAVGVGVILVIEYGIHSL
ncbi:MAG TPA: ZIP family metal transporter [Gammaproteobacteria bacterium]|jgi:zinc and cadmium transporter|nr:ZIP family metal transporter [Gammaproteobacteria bacterium]